MTRPAPLTETPGSPPAPAGHRALPPLPLGGILGTPGSSREGR